jgi:hypothetical protein
VAAAILRLPRIEPGLFEGREDLLQLSHASTSERKIFVRGINAKIILLTKAALYFISAEI